MDDQQALNTTNSLLIKQGKKILTTIESIIFREAWKGRDGKTYPQIADHEKYELGSIKTTASNLWKSLSSLFGITVKRNNLRQVVENYLFNYNKINHDPDPIYIDNARHKRHYDQLCKLPKQNLPPQQNEFIGRSTELCDLMRRLSPDYTPRIITVYGIGGVGKTALIVEAAYKCLEYRETVHSNSEVAQQDIINCQMPLFDAIIFITAKKNYLSPIGIGYCLNPEKTLQDILRTIVRTLNEPNILQGDPKEQQDNFRQIFRQQTTLLIIDNFETIEDKDSIIGFLNELPYTVKSVITTREKLWYASIPLENLTEFDGRQLIQQQANEKRISLTNEEEERIYKASNGIPIVIIHIIARMAMSYRIETVLADLKSADNDVFTFCFKNPVNNFKDHAAYKLLISMAIFHTAPKREAVIEVAGLSTEPMTYMDNEFTKLERFSLISKHNEERYRGRYRMLDIIREYALAELSKESSFKKEALERWVKWYLEYAQRYRKEKRRENLNLAREYGYKSLNNFTRLGMFQDASRLKSWLASLDNNS